MPRLPAECLSGAGARGGLIGGEDRAERAERLLRHGLHREPQSATDDRRDVAHGVALVGHVPCGPGRLSVPKIPSTALTSRVALPAAWP